jgi:signal peptidase I
MTPVDSQPAAARPAPASRWPRLARIGRRAAAVTVSVLLAAVCAIVVAAAVAGLRAVVVTGGSMEPTLHVGDAVFVRPDGAAGVSTGDLVVYRTRPDRPWTIHRVIDTRVVDHRLYFVTKGDRNKGTDPDLTPAEAVYGRAVGRVPLLGRVLYWIATPVARVLLAVMLAVVVAHELIIIARIHRRMRAPARLRQSERP